MLSVLSLSTGLTDILPVCIHDLQEIYNKKYAILFIVLIWKAHNFAENQTNSTEKLNKMGFCTFCKSTAMPVIHLGKFMALFLGSR